MEGRVFQAEGGSRMREHHVLVAFLAVALCAAAASAQTQGSLDVYLMVHPNVQTTPTVAGYQVELALSPTGGPVSMFGASQTDPVGPHPPLFPTGSPIVFPDGGDSIQVTDVLLSGEEEVQDGDGLFRVLFTVDPGTVNTEVDVEFVGMWTGLADGLGDPVPYVPTSGKIKIGPDGTVETTGACLTIIPEPASVVLLACGGLALLGRLRRHRRG
jgi:hypothetical protein